MSDNNAESIVKAPVAHDEVKAPDTTDSLPPITKEPAAPGSDTAAKPEVPAAAEAQEDSSNKLSKPSASAAQPEKPSDPTAAPAPESESTTTEAVASGVGSSAPTGPKDETVEPPKPVSVEETRDEDLPGGKPVDSKNPPEAAPKTDTTRPIATTGVETTEVPAVDSASVENGDVITSKKRKADIVEGLAGPEVKNGDAEPPEKKPKTNGAGTNGTARKPGRPRKDKKAVPAVGKTARKTRSQGTAD